jgi:hypothetical protein
MAIVSFFCWEKARTGKSNTVAQCYVDEANRQTGESIGRNVAGMTILTGGRTKHRARSRGRIPFVPWRMGLAGIVVCVAGNGRLFWGNRNPRSIMAMAWKGSRDGGGMIIQLNSWWGEWGSDWTGCILSPKLLAQGQDSLSMAQRRQDWLAGFSEIRRNSTDLGQSEFKNHWIIVYCSKFQKKDKN